MLRTDRSAHAMLRHAQAVVEPPMRAAVGRLGPPVRRVADYHLGWIDVEGRPANRPGKFLRPALALLSAEAARQPASAALPGALAVELVHNFSLLQDDIIDNDRQRRNQPAAWTLFGVGQALCASDALVVLAHQLLSEHEGSGPGAASRSLIEATQQMIEGQAVDVELVGSDVGRAAYLELAEAKTGALLACAASIGAELVGAHPLLVTQLRRFGRSLGVMFQVVDDILDVSGGPEVTGRPAGSDQRNNRASFPLIEGGGWTAALAEAERHQGPPSHRFRRPTCLTPFAPTSQSWLRTCFPARSWLRRRKCPNPTRQTGAAMSDDALMALVDRAVSDPDFRARAQADLDGTLAQEGIELGPEELEAVRDFQARAQGMSDDELNEALATSRRQGGPI